MTAEWIARIAADPVGERHKKVLNNKNNQGKASVLRKESSVRGVSRGKGKDLKRKTPEESGTNTTTRESTAEVPDAAARSAKAEA